MDKIVKVSVIIPVYNGEKYLRECLDSVINQSLKEIEIIIVDDGSKDNTLNILKQYEIKDPRIQILQQQNAGAGAARNKALSYAKGAYLSILDADDVFELDMLEKAYTKAIETDADITVYASDVFKDGETPTPCDWGIRKDLIPSFQPFNSNDVKKDIFRLFVGWAWDKLFKKSFVDQWDFKFQEQRTTNDALFVFDAIIQADKIVIIDEVLAYHRDNAQSLANTREKSWWCFYDALIAMKKDLIRFDKYDRFEDDYINYAINLTLWHLDTLAEPSHSKLLTKLKEGWLEDLGITNYPLDKAYNSYEYYRLEKMWKEDVKAVSIIIPVYNSQQLLEKTIDTLSRTTKEIEVICVDGNSSDFSCNILKKYENVKYINCPFPNFAHQIKMALECVRGKYFTIVTPNMELKRDVTELYNECITKDIDAAYLSYSISTPLKLASEESINKSDTWGNQGHIYDVKEEKLLHNTVSEYVLGLCKTELFEQGKLVLNEQVVPQQSYLEMIYSILDNISKTMFSNNELCNLIITPDAIVDKYSYYLTGTSSKSYQAIMEIQKEDFDSQPVIVKEVLQQKNNQIKALQRQLDNFNHSPSFKIGRAITYIPRKLLKKIKEQCL